MRNRYIVKLFFTGLALLAAVPALIAQDSKTAVASGSNNPGMMLLIVVGMLLLLSLGLAIILIRLKGMINSIKDNRSGSNEYKSIAVVLVLLLSGTVAMAQGDAGANNTPAASPSGVSTMMMIIIGLLLLLSLGLSVMVLRLTSLLKQQNRPAGSAEPKGALSSWWADLDKKFFTKAVPVEKEADVLLDHDYDGIKELDNALPPWWKWGFYITVILAVIYMFRFHMGGNGPSPEEEYNREMKVAQARIEEYQKKTGGSIDEKTVKMADAAGIAAGKAMYLKNCVACHLPNGAGSVGPNLTDDYWLHGGAIGDVFKTIRDGVQEKGMQSWKNTYSPQEMQNIASFILSLKGTKPAGGKEPQGTLYVPDAPKADSAGVKKDTAAASPATADAKPAK